MDFAKRQLEKYGWTEGQGLGKQENGIPLALKPKLKFDKFGIGHDSSEEYTKNWWDTLYNRACSNINISEDNGNVKVTVEDPDSVEINTKGYSSKSLKVAKNGLEYGSFLKTSKLTPSGIIHLGNKYNDSCPTHKIPILCEDELFAACGKRTAHKGARHGIDLSGKLSRIEKQEKLLLKQLKRVSISEDTNTKLEKKLKKIAEHKPRNSLDIVEDDTVVLDLPSGNQCLLGSPSSHKCKKRKKERRRVSFNDTVTEYQTHVVDEEASSSSTTNSCTETDSRSRPPTPIAIVRLVKIRDQEVDNNGNLPTPEPDEGIDCSNYDEAKDNLTEKIKKDNKKMKRKLKKLRSITAIQEAANHDHLETNCSKRKLFNDEDVDQVQLKKFHLDFSNHQLTRKQRKQLRKEKRMEKQVNKVAKSLDEFCKI